MIQTVEAFASTGVAAAQRARVLIAEEMRPAENSLAAVGVKLNRSSTVVPRPTVVTTPLAASSIPRRRRRGASRHGRRRARLRQLIADRAFGACSYTGPATWCRPCG